jgi:hypothetical protein
MYYNLCFENNKIEDAKEEILRKKLAHRGAKSFIHSAEFKMPELEDFYKKESFFANFLKYGKLFNELFFSLSLSTANSGDKGKKNGFNSNKNALKSKKSIVRKHTNSSKQNKKVLRMGSVAISAFTVNSEDSKIENEKESEIVETREPSKSVYFGDRRSNNRNVKSTGNRMSTLGGQAND